MFNLKPHRHYTNLAHKQPLPRNTSAIGNGGSQSSGGLLGNTDIIMLATSNVKLTVGKHIVMEIEDSADNENFSPIPVSPTRTSTPVINSWIADEVIIRWTVPANTREYIRVTIITDDKHVTGEVDVIFDYMQNI